MNKRLKNIVFFLLFVLLFVCLFFFVKESSRLFTTRVFELPGNLPTGDSAFLPTSAKGDLYRKKHYFISYSAPDRLSEWVAYELHSTELIKAASRDNKRFKQDTSMPGGVKYNEYTNSGYDRGHLVPAADMAFSDEAMTESFLMSNVAPQLPSFNRGIWNTLESKVRDWARGGEALYVITGSCWDSTSVSLKETGIPVPGYFYKVIFDTNRKSRGMIVFLMPHSDGLRNSLFDYVITVDSLEVLTGIDFFRQLPDNFENELESQVRARLWK